jgi:NTE family protein
VQINSLRTILPIALLAGLLAGCSTILQPDNEAITQIDENTGYRRLNYQSPEDFGDTLVLLAFSGGGTRAAALSYGVLQELRDTEIESKGALCSTQRGESLVDSLQRFFPGYPIPS